MMCFGCPPLPESFREVYNPTFQMSHILQPPLNRLPHWQLRIEISQAGSSLTTALQTQSTEQNLTFLLHYIKQIVSVIDIYMLKVSHMLIKSSFATLHECRSVKWVKSQASLLRQEPDFHLWRMLWRNRVQPLCRICFTDSACYRYQLLLFSEQLYSTWWDRILSILKCVSCHKIFSSPWIHE